MTLLIDNPAPHVRRLTLNRPERMNALDGPTLQMLNDAVRECGAAADVKVLVIRGQGAPSAQAMTSSGWPAGCWPIARRICATRT